MIASRRTILIASAVLGALLLALIVPNFRRAAASLAHPDPVGPTVYSKSAIGHIAFYNLLEDLELPTEISENGSGAHVGPGDILVVAEPRTDTTTLGEVKAMLDARAVLLVLPKRTGKADPDRPYWLSADKLVSEKDVDAVLHLVDPGASIARVSTISSLTGDEALDGSPTITKPQLMHSKLLKPLLAAPEGTLIGERRIGNRRIVVLSDPDIISNFALSRGDNSVVAVSLMEYLRAEGRKRPEDGSVIFDEFVHGFTPKPLNLLNILFQFPFVLVTVQMAAAIALLIWAATARFGAPVQVAPPLEAGKRSLIETGARLLTQAKRVPDISQRYVEAVIADTARSLRTPVAQVPDLPATPSPQEIWQWRKKLLGESRAYTKLD
jgi:hypothetical protein